MQPRVLLLAGLLVACCYASTYTFDASQTTTPFPHFWEECVGSGHALLALRADYREYLTRCRTELGFRHVRFHGLLDDDMSTYTTINGAPNYSFFNIDSIFDFLLSIDMRPVVEVSFMPELLASGNTTVFHYEANVTPPSSISGWNTLVSTLMTHLIDRYGIDEVSQWPFEIWNEPNCGFWTGTQQQYFELYAHTAKTIKSVDSRLVVGGPATCQSAWLTEFLAFTTANNVPVDFVSTHEYPTDMNPPLLSMESVVSKARSEVGDLPLYYTEYNDGLYSDPSYHDTSYAAAFIAKNAHDVSGYVDLWSWWTFSDIFEEQGFSPIPFGDPNGWGLLNRYGVPKPSYRSFQLLHSIGDQLLASSTSNATAVDGLEAYATYQMTQARKHRIDVVAYYISVPTSAPTASQTISIQVNGLPSTPTSATVNLIDPKHCNPASAWEGLGSPAYPNQLQLDLLNAASIVTPSKITLKSSGSGNVNFDLTLMPQSVAFVSFEY